MHPMAIFGQNDITFEPGLWGTLDEVRVPCRSPCEVVQRGAGASHPWQPMARLWAGSRGHMTCNHQTESVHASKFVFRAQFATPAK